jgi:hypothetical protein
MTRIMGITLMLALGGALPAAAVPTTAPSTAAMPARPVQIGFVPPLGQILRFRITRTRTADNRAQGPASLDFTARFTEAGDHYLMAIQFELPQALRGTPSSAMTNLLLRPMVLRLNEGGEIVALENEAAYWARMRAALAQFVRSEGGPPEGQALMTEIIDRMQAMPDGPRIEKLSESVSPIVGGASILLTPREAVQHEAVADTIVGPMPMRSSVMLERVEGGIAIIAITSRVPGEALLKGTRDMIARVTAAAGMPSRPLRGDTRILSVDHRETIHVSVETGISRRYESVRTVRMAEGEGESTVEQRLLIERLQ